MDKVLLYSYQQDGKGINRAASLHISYEGYAAAPAEGAPMNAASATAALASENLEADLGCTVDSGAVRSSHAA